MSAALEGALIAVAALMLAAVGLPRYGERRWRRRTDELVHRLRSAAVRPARERFDASELEDLPASVRRYLRAVLRDGAPIVTRASIEHTGTFNTSETGERWKPFRSRQWVLAQRPGFVWDARIAIAPGVAVHVHDAYVAGEGLLRPSILGLFALTEVRGGADLARGELLRFLAEAAWYPTVLLAGRGLSWEALDERSARATLVDSATSVSLTFHFGADALIASVHAEARGRTVGGKVVPTRWEGRWGNYQERDGMKVPISGEAAWLLPEGRRPYWRGEVTAIGYEFSR